MPVGMQFEVARCVVTCNVCVCVFASPGTIKDVVIHFSELIVSQAAHGMAKCHESEMIHVRKWQVGWLSVVWSVRGVQTHEPMLSRVHTLQETSFSTQTEHSRRN